MVLNYTPSYFIIYKGFGRFGKGKIKEEIVYIHQKSNRYHLQQTITANTISNFNCNIHT